MIICIMAAGSTLNRENKPDSAFARDLPCFVQG
jgi:hypothetical protein